MIFERATLLLSTKKALQFFEKIFRFSENLFQSESIEIDQNFMWLKNYFESP